MKLRIWLLLPALMLSGCTEEKTYITGPGDWQPPVLGWQNPPEAEVRGRVGLDLTVEDASAVDSVRLFVDGRPYGVLTAAPYRFEVVTDSLSDGSHLAEARGWDRAGNLGISPVLLLEVSNSMAQGPRLLWVPDEFERIQDAINAATDYDTIRVRDGTYYETLNLFGKGIWLESENGPIACRIDAGTFNNAIYFPSSTIVVTVRGFSMTGSGYVINLDGGSRVAIFNNIVFSDSAESLLVSSYSNGAIDNNLFSHSIFSLIQLGFHWGTLYNNILQNGESYGLWNASLYQNPVEFGYNLLWQNEVNYNDRFPPGVGDLYENPLLDLESGSLLEGSPAIDAGNPTILDRNGTRSDIGPFGGPNAY